MLPTQLRLSAWVLPTPKPISKTDNRSKLKVFRTMNNTTNTPMGDKVQVSKSLHDETYQNYMRALDTASCFRLIIAAIPKGKLNKQQLSLMWQTLGDVQAILGGELKQLSELSDFMGSLSIGIHEECFACHSKALNVLSILRLSVGAIPEGVDSKSVQVLGDIQATLTALLPELSAIADFLDTLHFSVMEVNADNQGGES